MKRKISPVHNISDISMKGDSPKSKYLFDGSERTLPPSGSCIEHNHCSYSADDTEYDCGASDYTDPHTDDEVSILDGQSFKTTSTKKSSDIHKCREHHKHTKRHEKLLKDIHQKACRYLRAGRLEDSLRQFNTILVSLTEKYDRKHERVGTALHNVGVVHLRSGNLDKALNVILEAIRIRRAKLGAFHPKVSESLVELGILQLSKNIYDEALDTLEEALEIQDRKEYNTVAKDRSRAALQKAKILNNIGCVHFESGNVEGAMEAYEKSLFIQRDIFKIGNLSGIPGFLALSTTICNLGYVYMDKLDWELAVFQFEDALQIQKSILISKGHKVIMNTLYNIGYASVKDGNYDSALKIYEEILQIEKSNVGIKDIRLASTMKMIVYAKIRLCQYEEALKNLYEIEEIESESYGRGTEEDLLETRELISLAHYQSMKYPGLIEMLMTTLTKNGFRDPWDNEHVCKCGNDFVQEELKLLAYSPKRPLVRTKMSGHKISYA